MKFGVATYGMNQWEGGCFDLEQRLLSLKKIGYDGVEKLQTHGASDALGKAVLFRKNGMDFGTCGGPDIQASIQWTSGLGKEYIWLQSKAKDFDTYCRHANTLVKTCSRWGIRVGCHNHLGSLVESQKQIETFLDRVPGAGLVFDTAHCAAAGGNCVELVKKYDDRMIAIHLKDWLQDKPISECEHWSRAGRFCELGAGNIGLDNAMVMNTLTENGYDGWIFVEHDTHLQDPIKDLAISREFLRSAGY